MLRKLLTLVLAMTIATSTAQAADPENTLYLDLKDGRVVIELRPDLAPNHVARIKERPTVHIPYKSEPRPERAPEPISTFMANLLTRYGINPTGMTAIEAHNAYRNVPNHIKARVNAEMRKKRLDKNGARL